MITYGGHGPTVTHALINLGRACLTDRREIDLSTLDHNAVKEGSGAAVLHVLTADTHPMEGEDPS